MHHIINIGHWVKIDKMILVDSFHPILKFSNIGQSVNPKYDYRNTKAQQQKVNIRNNPRKQQIETNHKPSNEQDAIRLPSLSKSTDDTGSLCAGNCFKHFPVFTSQIRTFSSYDPDTNLLDCGLKHKQNT